MKQQNFENKVLKSLKETLSPIVAIDKMKPSKVPGTSYTPDAVLKLPRKYGGKRLIIEAKNSGEPRIIRTAALQLKRCMESLKSAYGIIAAPYISAQSAEICREEGLGYLDLSGNCFIKFENIYIDKSGKPNKFIEKKKQRSLFSTKATRILRVLLTDLKKDWGVRELAEEADVSPGYVSRIKKALVDQEWLGMKNGKICLKNPEEVLSEWANAEQLRENKAYKFFSLKKPKEIEEEIAAYCTKKKLTYGLTGFSSAIRYAPMVPSKTVSAFIDGDISRIADDLGLKTVDTGANITILSPYDKSVFYEKQAVDGISLVSPIQTYLDLINVKGRGEEAAKAVFEKKIGVKW